MLLFFLQPLAPPALRRQDACIYICICGNETSNSCRLCSGCHQRGKYDLRKGKIQCTYKYCVNTFKRESKKND